jgi:hypothetical protein
MKFNTREFTIGDVVRVSSIYVSNLSKSGVKSWLMISRKDGSIFGQVVGIGRRQEGRIVHDYDAGTYFEPSKYITGWLVRTGLTNKPLFVPSDGIEKVGAALAERYVMPIQDSNRASMPERERQALSEDSKTWPRDERGRWISDHYINTHS